jgi:hypothetical protein
MSSCRSQPASGAGGHVSGDSKGSVGVECSQCQYVNPVVAVAKEHFAAAGDHVGGEGAGVGEDIVAAVEEVDAIISITNHGKLCTATAWSDLANAQLNAVATGERVGLTGQSRHAAEALGERLGVAMIAAGRDLFPAQAVTTTSGQ